MKENKDNKDLDIEIIMGDDSELNYSDIKDSIKTLRPKEKTKNKNIIIPKLKNDNKKDENN